MTELGVGLVPVFVGTGILGTRGECSRRGRVFASLDVELSVRAYWRSTRTFRDDAAGRLEVPVRML